MAKFTIVNNNYSNKNNNETAKFLIIIGLIIMILGRFFVSTFIYVIAFIILINSLFKLFNSIHFSPKNIVTSSFEFLVTLIMASLVFSYPYLVFKVMGAWLIVNSCIKIFNRSYVNFYLTIAIILVGLYLLISPDKFIFFIFNVLGLLIIIQGVLLIINNNKNNNDKNSTIYYN